jgi:hypothetical protein
MGSRSPLAVVAVIALVVLAGCSSGQTQTTPTPEQASTNTDIATQTSTEQASESKTDTPTPTPEPDPLRQNPWASNPVVIQVTNGVNESRNFVPLARQAANYWNDNATVYTDFKVNFTVNQSHPNPDVELNITDSIRECGNETDSDDFLGCAPLYTEDSVVRETTDVQIISGQTNATTVRTIKHELGHTLGLEHEDSERLPLMSAVDDEATSLPITNASDREFPFGNSTIHVYIDYGDRRTQYTDEASRRVNDSLGWFERGAADYLNDKHRFVFTNSPAEADIRIRFRQETPCEFDRICWESRGLFLDSDPAPEEVTALNITISKRATNADEVAWLVGWPISKLMINDKATERPSPFDDNVIDDGYWWKE